MPAKRIFKKIWHRNLLLSIAVFVFTAAVLLTFSRRAGLFVIGPVPVTIAGDSGNETNSVFTGSGLRARMDATVRALNGKKIWDIDMNSLRASIVNDQWVKDVLISRSFPASLKIQVTQKTPILVMINKNGLFQPITTEGEVLSELPPGSLPDVPILRSEGLGVDETDILRHRQQIVDFVRALPALGILSRKNISEIAWNRDDGINLTIIDPKVEVKLGEEVPDFKIVRVTQVLNYLAEHDLKERVIDASFSKKVLVRLRKAP